MKKTMSVREFKLYVEECKPSVINFCSSNQGSFAFSSIYKFDLSFSQIEIRENPNTIYLISDKAPRTNILYFDLVNFVELETEESNLGVIVRIFCGGTDKNSLVVAFTLILSRD